MTIRSTLKTAFLSTALLVAGCKDKTPEPDYNSLQPETIQLHRGLAVLDNGGGQALYINKTSTGDEFYGDKAEALNLMENAADATATTTKIEGLLGQKISENNSLAKYNASAMSITVDLIPDQILDVPKAGDPSATRKAKVDKVKFTVDQMTIAQSFTRKPAQTIINRANANKFTVRKIDLK